MCTWTLQFRMFCYYANSFESFIAFRMLLCSAQKSNLNLNLNIFTSKTQKYISLTAPRAAPQQIFLSNFETHSHKKLKWSSYLGEYFFPKGVLISQEKSTPGSTYFLGNKYWGVLISWEISTGEYLFTGVLFYGDTGIKHT